MVRIAIIFIHPYPWLLGRTFVVHNPTIDHDIYYHLNDALSLFMLVRMVRLMPVILALTQWQSLRASRIW